MVEGQEHLGDLLEEHRKALQVLELQAAGYGKLAVPTHIVTQIEWRREQIVHLESKLSEAAAAGAALPRENSREDAAQGLNVRGQLRDLWQDALRRRWPLAVLLLILIGATFAFAQIYDAVTGTLSVEPIYEPVPTHTPMVTRTATSVITSTHTFSVTRTPTSVITSPYTFTVTPKPTPTTSRSVEELISILDHRASKIIGQMEEAKQSALDTPSAKQIDAIQQLFEKWHNEHVEALRGQNFTLAHEIMIDIQHLLLIQCSGILSDVHYYSLFLTLLTCLPEADTYTGPLPDHLIPAIPEQAPVSKQDLDTDRLRRIAVQIEAQMAQMH